MILEGVVMKYAVRNAASFEMLSDWVDSREEAEAMAAESEQHETEPECEILMMSGDEYALRQFAEDHRGEDATIGAQAPCCDGWYLECTHDGTLTGKLISAYEDGCRFYRDNETFCAMFRG
jgi:hypothetical protein